MHIIRAYHQPTKQVLAEFVAIQKRVFESPYTEQQIADRMADKEYLLLLHAYEGDRVVGFKAGYELAPRRFYSWVGGVDPEFRGRGIAQALMHEQHQQLKADGFLAVETKTQNKFREMLILNLRSGFDIRHTFEEDGRGLQIVLQKDFCR